MQNSGIRGVGYWKIVVYFPRLFVVPLGHDWADVNSGVERTEEWLSVRKQKKRRAVALVFSASAAAPIVTDTDAARRA